MGKLRAAVVVIALMVVGLLLLSSLPVAGQGAGSFLARTEHAFLRSCEQASNPERCTFVVRLLQLLFRTSEDDQLTNGAARELRRVLNLPAFGVGCTNCKNAVLGFEVLLENNSTIAEIEDVLEQGCADRLHDAVTVQQCKAFIDQYVPQAIEMLHQKASPTAACVAMNFCSP